MVTSLFTLKRRSALYNAVAGQNRLKGCIKKDSIDSVCVAASLLSLIEGWRSGGRPSSRMQETGT